MPAPTLAQKSTCKPGVKPVQDALGYRQRGDRCEGIYWQPHAGETAIVVLAVTSGPPPPSIPGDALPVRWPAQVPGATDGDVQLEAVSVRRGLFYRMDAVGALKKGRYEWPTDVLRSVGLGASEFALQARVPVRVGAISWPAYLPVGLGDLASSPGPLTVRLASGVPLYRLSWECLRMDSGGMPGTSLARGELEGPFPADQPFDLRLPLPGFSGYCYLDLKGAPMAGWTDTLPTLSAVIFVPGDSETQRKRW